MAHVHGRADNEQERTEMIIGKGKGDPDIHGYPGEGDPRWVGSKPKIEVRHADNEIPVPHADGSITLEEIPF
jgi:hypothetical protein